MAITRGKTSSIRQGAKNTSMLAGYPPTMAAPTATAGVVSASVAFTAVSGATSYTVISNPGNITATGTSSPIAVTGLTAATAYTFRISATNTIGTSGYSAASNSVTPISLILISQGTSPYINAYPFSGSGFGTRYSNPATLAPGTGNGTAFNPGTNSVALAHTTTPFFTVWAWSNSSGFGTKYTDPSPAVTESSGTGLGVEFSPSNDAIALGMSSLSSPYIQAYRWSSSGWGTRYANPSSGLNNSTRGIDFIPAGNVLGVANIATPFINAYAWTSESGFGTKFADPSNLPPGGLGLKFNAQGTVIGATYSNATPYLAFYPWSSGFGTRYSAPGTPPPGIAWDLSWHPSGNAVAVAHSTTPFISAWAWSSGFGSKFANPATGPGDTTSNVAFDSPGSNVAIASSGSQTISVYPWSSGFGTRYANPATMPGANNGSPNQLTFL